MASLVETLTASGGTESAGFLNDIIAQLWPNINVAAGRIAKETVEPMFAAMLPGPLASLRFAKLDLGPVPLRLSAVDVHKIEDRGIKLDMDLDWDGQCDIDLEGNMVPRVGVQHVKMKGRLSVLLCPLTNAIPLIGAVQVAFINPPTINMDFTDAANIADCALIEKSIRKVMINIISAMAVLPNRFLLKLDPTTDFLQAYQPHRGVLRVTIGGATGIPGPKPRSGVLKLLDKVAKDIPDCYCNVNVGAEEVWRTSTKKNCHDPQWNETHDFLVTDQDQCIMIDVNDDDMVGDDDIGVAVTTVKQILLAGGKQELTLVHDGQPTTAKVTVKAKFYNLVAEESSLSAARSQGEGQICGVATVLVAGALGIPGQPEALKPSVKVVWGAKNFRTPIKTHNPGVDIFNPTFDSAFRIPITSSMLANPAHFKIVLMNEETESGTIDIPFTDVARAPGMVLENKFDVGTGAAVRARITLCGLQEA